MAWNKAFIIIQRRYQGSDGIGDAHRDFQHSLPVLQERHFNTNIVIHASLLADGGVHRLK
jgi:hypothetical protein